MPKNLANIIGDRGEIIFELAITYYSQFSPPLFKPAFLGEKWKPVDYYVELCGVKNETPFFFVQVKTTQNEIDLQNQILNINVSKEKCENLFKVTAPTYLVGIHEPSQRAFIISVYKKPSQGIYQIPLQYELTPNNLEVLHREVCDFWKYCPYKPLTSYFL
ncbi:MAG: hypothetical protein VKL41_03885 [Snowella sp.]|nr:hypothetical protein [Snowella sp.]